MDWFQNIWVVVDKDESGEMASTCCWFLWHNKNDKVWHNRLNSSIGVLCSVSAISKLGWMLIKHK